MSHMLETDILVRNQARCLECGDAVTSRTRHDFVTCSCGALAVDGGQAYLRRVVRPGANYEEQSLYAPDEPRDVRLEHSEQVLHGVHHSAGCLRPQRCTIHARTDHPLRAWPQEWSGIMWRVCEHGDFHPDPDELDLAEHVADHRRTTCDGCCAGAYDHDEPAT